jgi:subtilisin
MFFETRKYERMSGMIEQAESTGQIVILNDSIDVPRMARTLGRRYNIPVHETFTRAVRGFSTRIPDSVLQRMLQRDGASIVSIEEDLSVRAFAQTVPWGVERVGATARATVPGTSVDADIFVLDTGVQAKHPDLNVVESLSFVRTEKSTDDMNGHGTGVAGCAAARDNTVYMAVE